MSMIAGFAFLSASSICRNSLSIFSSSSFTASAVGTSIFSRPVNGYFEWSCSTANWSRSRTIARITVCESGVASGTRRWTRSRSASCRRASAASSAGLILGASASGTSIFAAAVSKASLARSRACEVS